MPSSVRVKVRSPHRSATSGLGRSSASTSVPERSLARTLSSSWVTRPRTWPPLGVPLARLPIGGVAGSQDLVQNDRPQRAQRKVVELEVAELHIRAAGGKDERDRSDGKVGALAKVDFGVDPYFGADHRDQAEQVQLDSADDAARDAVHERAELRDEAEKDRGDRRDDEDPDGEHAGDAHDADVLGVGGLAGAAEQAADDRPEAVAHERTA